MTIYLIAGPPGIGKSTNASGLIPIGIRIIDQDLAGYQYKKQGFTDYQDLASVRSNQTIRNYLFAQQDFALELNLGFQSHYDYLKSIAYFDPANEVHLLLFFTDFLALCIDRAKVRHLNGGHEVKPEIIEEMYANTFPLFQKHKSLFHTIRLIDVGDTTLVEYSQDSKNLPAWIIDNELVSYLPLTD